MGQVPSTLRGFFEDMNEKEITPWYPVLIFKQRPKEHFKPEGECFEFINREEKEEDRKIGVYFTYSLIEKYHGPNFFSYALMASHHKAVISDSASIVSFPEYSKEHERWLFPGTETLYQTSDPKSWMSTLFYNTALMPATRRLLTELEEKTRMLLGDPMYGTYMTRASDLLDGLFFLDTKESARGLLFQGSARVAQTGHGLPEYIHRVTLSHNHPKDVPWNTLYESCSEVFLDDTGLLSKTTEFGLPPDGQFFQEIEYCFNRIRNKLPVFVHCSQGQSRSGLFVSVLITVLHLRGVIRLHDIIELESEALFYRAVIWASSKHPPLVFSEIWHTFVDFFMAYHLYLDKFFSFPEYQ